MKNFVNYKVHRSVYKFNKNGEVTGVLRHVYCNGTARLDRNFIGAIRRQNPELFPCSAISVSYREL